MGMGPIIRAFVIAFAMMLCTVQAHAFDETALAAAESDAVSMRADLERVVSVIGQAEVTDDQLATQRGILEKLRLNAVAQVDVLNAPGKDVGQQLNQLGPAPEKGATEAVAIAAQRQTLAQTAARISAAQKQFGLLSLEAEQTTAKISALQRAQFFQRVFRPDVSIFNPQLWSEAAAGAGLLQSRLSNVLSFWWQNLGPNVQWTALLLFPGVFLALAIFYRVFKRMVGKWLGLAIHDERTPSPLRRLWRVVGGLIVVAAVLLLFNTLLTASIGFAGLSTPRFDLLVSAFIGILSPVIFQTAVAYFICAPGNPQYRLVAVDGTAARTITAFVALSALMQSFTTQLSTLADQLLLPLSLVAGQSAVASASLVILVGLLLLALKRQSYNVPEDVPEPHYLTWFVKFFPLLWFLLIVAIAGLCFGYLALSYFITGKLLDTVLVVVLMGIVHHFIDAFVESLQIPDSRLGGKLRALTNFTDLGIARLSLIIRTLSDILVVILGIPWLFALWTLTWIDFRSLISNTLIGVRFGNFYISPVNILSIFGVFIVGILVTRFITGWFDQRVLTQTRLNKGVQNSVKTGANYFGYILAAAIALSAAGFDFSRFTIIAGALGVGIGFGLQSIVNNFVSGLILLAERPVRVGDWVVVAAGEGIVKNINVRSTEIETFDNCTIIVPNSYLITEAVRNWTHRDTIGRFLVAVGVKHGSDAEQIVKLLTEVVQTHSKVLRYPPAIVQLARFSPLTMDFEIRGHVADVFEAYQVASDLRIAVSKKFAAAGIVIPTYLDMQHQK